MFPILESINLISANSDSRKKWENETLNPIFRLPRLPKEAMLQLEDELSRINIPCKVNQSLVDKILQRHQPWEPTPG